MTDEEGARRPGHGQLLGLAVRRRREALNLTQEDLAERIGGEVDANYVTHLETGRRVRLPEQPLFGRLARALGAREVDLLVEAGFITEPLPVQGAPRPLFPPGSSKAKVVELLAQLDEPSAREVVKYCNFQLRYPVLDEAEHPQPSPVGAGR